MIAIKKKYSLTNLSGFSTCIMDDDSFRTFEVNINYLDEARAIADVWETFLEEDADANPEPAWRAERLLPIDEVTTFAEFNAVAYRMVAEILD